MTNPWGGWPPIPQAEAEPNVWVPDSDEILRTFNLLAWYDAANVETNAGLVTRLLDRSDAGNHSIVQANAAKRVAVTNSINGFPALNFAGGQCYQVTLNVTSFTIITVIGNVTASGVIHEQSADSGVNPGFFLQGTSGDTCRVRKGATSSARNIAATWAVGIEPSTVTHHYGPAGTHLQHSCTLRGNSQTPNATASAGGNPGIAAVNDVINIGARNDAASLGLTGSIAAWMIFSPALTGYLRDAITRSLSFQYLVGNG